MCVQLRISKEYPGLGEPAAKDRVLMRLGKRYFGGPDFETAICRAKELNEKGIRVIMDLLGEADNASGSLNHRVQRTLAVGSAINDFGLHASMAVRPGQFGNDVRASIPIMLKVIKQLNHMGIFTDMDMERRRVAGPTLSAYEWAVQDNPGKVGLAMPAYWADTLFQLHRIIEFSARLGIEVHIRPVRGVYVKEADVKNRARMHENLARMMHLMATCGVSTLYQHLGSHHPDQVARFIQLRRAFDARAAEVEYLLGVCKGPMIEVLEQYGMPRAVYFPFGPSLYAYGKRRMTETPAAVFAMAAAGHFENKNARRVRMLMENCEIDLSEPTLPFVRKPDVAIGERAETRIIVPGR